METWTSDELNKIGTADELDIASLRQDGTLRNPVTIWVVRVGAGLYVRAYKGRSGPWFRGVLTRHAGHIRSGGVDKEVSFVEVSDPAMNDQVDAAYRSKYGHYEAEYVDPMVAGKLLDQMANKHAQPSSLITDKLTGREVDVLRQIARGLSNAEIAENLRLSEGTIRNHVSAIFSKLDVTDRTQAAILAIRHGLDQSESPDSALHL